MFKGSCVALVTPMDSNGEVNYSALSDLVEWHLEKETQAIVAVGSTGESCTLKTEEKIKIFKHVVEVVKQQIPVIGGIGSYCTQSTIELGLAAKEAKVDGCLVVTPYYNRPTAHGLEAHFTAIAKAVNLPHLLYNVPARTACDLQFETVETLSQIANIVGIKEASGDVDRVDRLKTLGPEFKLYSGDDDTAFEFNCKGGDGVISISANIVPAHMQNLYQALANNEMDLAVQINDTLSPLHQQMGVESNPIPVKWALMKMGKIPSGIRLPLTQLSRPFHKALENVMMTLGVINEV